MILEPGIEVECIDDRYHHHSIEQHSSGIKKGSKYIISKIYPNAEWMGIQYFGVDLVGIDYYIPLYATRFRPIKKHKTDISVFKELLKEEELID